MWYVQDEFGADLFQHELKEKNMPSDTKVIQNVAMFPDSYPVSAENAVVLQCCAQDGVQSLCLFLPAFKPNEPALTAPFWTEPRLPGCSNVCCLAFNVDHQVSGLISQDSRAFVALHDWSSHQNPVCHQSWVF